jgi:hypothetical protein
MSAVVEMFANRVRKNARHLAKWAKRDGVTCWRVYDRDIPEVPVTLDTYEGALVLNDYRIDPTDHAWLDALGAAARTALSVDEIFVKRRERLTDRQDGHQYERQDTRGVWRTVHEAGRSLRVNLSDYIDTGLFLDHRITRARAAAESATTMLNLYCYTGAFSVHCAAAGMRTTSVDLSNTYLDWANENLALNKLTGELIHADVREFLADARRARLRPGRSAPGPHARREPQRDHRGGDGDHDKLHGSELSRGRLTVWSADANSPGRARRVAGLPRGVPARGRRGAAHRLSPHRHRAHLRQRGRRRRRDP